MTPAAALGAGGGRVRGLALRLWSSTWVWSTGVQALQSGISLVVSVVAARLLGVAGFGAYVLVQAGVALLAVLQYQLVSGPMAVASGHRTRTPPYFSAVARGALAAAALVGLAVALYVEVLVRRPDMLGGAWLPVAAALFGAGFVAHDSAKRLAFATNRPRLAFASECARHLLFAAMVAAAWFAWEIDTSTLLACGGLAALITVPIYAGTLRARVRPVLHRAVWQHHWVLGRWLALVVFVSAAHEQLVTILAGSWLGEDAAAGLRSAQILLGPLLVLMTSLEYIMPRRAAQRLREGGEAALIGYLLRILVLLEVPIVATCVVIAAYSADILRLLLGADYARFSGIAAIIAIGPPLILARDFAVICLRVTRRTSSVFAAFAASALVTLVAAYPLIAAHGVAGAACVVILGHAVSTAAVLFLTARAALRAGR
ncbi:hypothetical protein Q8W71_21900 [Methylobacterium sp. NEAU 140]|uniref:lipopolysaccharide biosynthesis protein n=1 Tax=Methylobacterium sp. NEAU 140 TaxID=3064945 RepID=UPI0027331EE8|nr:hypothetical protein [Methylobacterium sp. NEAU 140]MDP4025288.1 hypothetical protein [Methylobacterium sp. NEAU 140]